MFTRYENSLLRDFLKRESGGTMKKEKEDTEYRKLLISAKSSLGMISGLYLYTGTPPHGYGTQAPKVAETVKRAYGFNKKKDKKSIQILGKAIERTHWEKEDGSFPFNEVHSNYIPSEARMMVENFLKTNCPYIDTCVEGVMQRILGSNSDVLTKGRQTYCPFIKQSVTAAVAYKNMYDFLSNNSGYKCFSCLEWIQAFFELMSKDKIVYKTTKWEEVQRKVYSKEDKMRKWITTKRKKIVTIETSNNEETKALLIELATGFASYIKHKERGKKDRRAIASAGMILRMFLYIVEEFHLELSKKIEGATISIGGEEKKAKISNNMSSATLSHGPAGAICQGTEDATKWNECLSPSLFALVHLYLFDRLTRSKLGLPQATEFGALFQKIAIASNFLLSMKKVQLGKGITIQNGSEYSRLEWKSEYKDTMNEETKEWFNEVEHLIVDNGENILASPGMLMGMHNALSTVVGLLAVNHRMSWLKMKVLTLRSSDDSMSLYIGNSSEDNKECVEMNRRNLGMLGINLSPDKTFFFVEGFGEYTSWYMDNKFVSQFGTETASLRPKGVNPPDDFHSVAKETATALSTLTVNHFGATARLRIGIDGVRRLWRVERIKGKREGISDQVLLLSDGGPRIWDCTNCHLEETCMREKWVTSDEEKHYLLRIRNPENPFSSEPVEEASYSKEHGTLIAQEIEIPRTCFHYLKKSNRTLNREDKMEESRNEQCNHEAAQIINLVDPTTLISAPSSSASISSHLSALLQVEGNNFELDEEEKRLLQDAVSVLEEGRIELLNTETDETWYVDEVED